MSSATHDPAAHAADASRAVDEQRRTLERFIELVGHDLRTPLATVSAAVGMLSSLYGEQVDPKDRPLFEIAEHGLDRLHTMLEGLLTYARAGLESGDHAPVDLNGVVASAARQAPDLTITAPDLPKVHGDEVLLEHLFANLFSNAERHGREGVPPALRVTAQRRGDRWHLDVCDNGTGIPPEDRARVLLPFERLDNRAPTSTGLGLAIVGRVAEAHGSQVEVDESDEGGACFRFSLPAAQD